MKVRFYTSFPKRNNSTKQISSEAYTQLDLVLKEATSIENPVFLISGNHFNYTYAYIPDWNRYYFVDQILSSAKDLTQITLKEDYLASWKSDIGNTAAMILRSSSNYNVWIPDEEVYVSTQKTLVREVGSNSVYFGDYTGCYLYSVVNKKGSYSNFAAQYYTNATGIQSLADELLDGSLLDDIVKYYNNVSNAIISVKWMPFDFTSVSSDSTMTSLENVWIANNMLTFADYRITGSSIYIDGSQSIPIPWRSDKDFRESNPYTELKLLIPMYGIIDLNAADYVGASNVVVQYRVDRTTGDVIVIVNSDTAGAVTQTVQFNVAVEMPIATLTRNIGGAVSAISGGINSAIGMAAGNYIGGGVGLISSAAQFALSANGRSVSLKGALTGKAATAYGDKFQLLLYTPHTLDPTNLNYIATKGRPVQAVDLISNFSGYVRCEDASVSINGLDSEREAINSYLNGGFYYE